MSRLAILAGLALLAVVATAADYEEQFVADKEFLTKQKLVYEVLYHYQQPSIDANLHEKGLKYNPMEHLDSYEDKEAVKRFVKIMDEFDVKLHETVIDAVYSVYYYPKETSSVLGLMLQARDFETFYNMALYMRARLNHELFAYSFYLAVIQREDTRHVRLPPLYEIVPYMFYNSEILEKAHHVEYFGEKEPNRGHRDSYVLPYKYSGFYLNDEYDYNYEGLLNYFTEDIGLNEYYFYLRNQFPHILNNTQMSTSSVDYRGEEYLYSHKQILARYHLERVANGLGPVEHFDWHSSFYPGYKPTLTYPSGLPFPARPWDTSLPKGKRHHVDETIRYETRIADMVDSGFLLQRDGSRFDIYADPRRGLSALGDAIEGNADSMNSRYYGNVEELMRHVLGFGAEPASRFQAQPSALEHFATSLRDPAFYRITFKLLHHYQRFQQNQGPYTRQQIQYPELKIESVDMDRLETYFSSFDSSIGNGLAVRDQQEAHSRLIKARQMRLDHRPFRVNVTVRAERPTTTSVKVFIGPKYDVHGRPLEFADVARDYYYEIDNFLYELKTGVNLITRDQFDFTSNDSRTYEELYDQLVEVLESEKYDDFKVPKHIHGFPSRLILPKGRSGDGLPLQMFVHVAPLEGEPLEYRSPVFGSTQLDNRAFGYPLDRPIVAHDFVAPNMYSREIRVYHK